MVAKIIYYDHDKICPTVTWFGIEFKDGEPVDLDQFKHLSTETKAEMLMRAGQSPYYRTTEEAGPPPTMPKAAPKAGAPGTPTWPDEEHSKGNDDKEKSHEEGRQAADAGQRRDARHGPEWIRGFDERMKELEDEAEHSQVKDPRRNK